MQDVKVAKSGFGTSIARVQRGATPADFNLIVLRGRGIKVITDITISNTDTASVVVRAEDYVYAGRVLIFEGEFNPEGDWFSTAFDPLIASFDAGAFRRYGVNNLLRDFIVWGGQSKHYRFGGKGLRSGTADVTVSILGCPFYISSDAVGTPTGGRSVIAVNGYFDNPYSKEKFKLEVR